MSILHGGWSGRCGGERKGLTGPTNDCYGSVLSQKRRDTCTCPYMLSACCYCTHVCCGRATLAIFKIVHPFAVFILFVFTVLQEACVLARAMKVGQSRSILRPLPGDRRRHLRAEILADVAAVKKVMLHIILIFPVPRCFE